MEQHQNRKVEIDAREDSFQDVVKMGKDLIARNHYATPEVKIFPLLIFLPSLLSSLLPKERRKLNFLYPNAKSKIYFHCFVYIVVVVCLFLLLAWSAKLTPRTEIAHITIRRAFVSCASLAGLFFVD